LWTNATDAVTIAVANTPKNRDIVADVMAAGHLFLNLDG